MSEKGKKTSNKGKGKPTQTEEVESPATEAKQEKKAEKKAEKKEDAPKSPQISEETKKEETKETPPTQSKKPANNNNSPAPEKKEKKEPKTEKVRENGKGVVKAVLSGDTIIVINLSKNQSGPPQEKIIGLSNLNAPPLARRKQDEKDVVPDKPFAWQSREFLRTKLIGKQVTYVIEAKGEKKDYGIVFLDNENISKDIVSNGWARVRRPPGQKELYPEVEELVKLEESASSSGKGVFSKVDDEGKSVVRRIIEVTNPTEILPKFKGTLQTGVVEQVKSGNSFRIMLTPSFYDISLILSGVDCPSSSPKSPEAFGREARFFTEHHLLNREVNIVFEGADKYNFYGTLSYNGRYIGEELLKEGLGRYVEWSGTKSALGDRLKQAENIAKEKRLRLWVDYISPKPLSRQEEKKVAKPGKEISGKVIEVSNGGCIVILDQANIEHKIYLSSVKLPRQGPPIPTKEETKEEALERSFAWEAKEFLRKKVIGAKVRCVLDYTREGPPQQNPKRNQKTPEERNYCSVYLDKNNIAVELVEQGYATPQEHRGGEARSRDYEHIIFAETRAKKSNKGLHAPKDTAPMVHIVDISMDPKASKQKFPFLQRHGRMRGVVEYEFSASRFKILVPKESCQIVLSLSGVQIPTKDSEYFKPALLFCKEKIHQHDVDFEVIAQDTKGAGFVGNVWLGKQSLACLLLEQGYAKIYRAADRDSEMIIAEDIAKRAKKNWWHDYDEAKEEAKRKERLEEHKDKVKPKQEYIDIVVTEIVDGSKFFAQVVGQDAEQLEDLMKKLSAEDPGEPHKPQYDELVKAQFTADDAWYRAKVQKVLGDDQFQVFYVDYGNSEVLPVSRIRKLANEYKTLKPQAIEAVLAYLKTPPIEDDFGKEAAEFLKELVWGKTMMANIERRDLTGTLHLSLGDRESQVHVNAALLRAGLARVERVRGEQYREMLEKLREEESKARSSHVGVWEYGDPGSDEDDDDRGNRQKRRN